MRREEDGLDPVTEIPLDNHSLWWKYVPGANWRHPKGPKSSITGWKNIRSCRCVGTTPWRMQMGRQTFADRG